MSLTIPDPSQYDAIIYQKIKAFADAKNLAQNAAALVSDDMERQSREIDEFGEIAVKRLEQPYRKDFSDADVEQVISGYQSGKSTIALAEEFGCSKNTINKLLREHGVNVTKAKAQAKLDAKVVIAMYGERHTIEEIAECFGVSSYLVNRCLRSNRVKIRSRWDYTEKK